MLGLAASLTSLLALAGAPLYVPVAVTYKKPNAQQLYVACSLYLADEKLVDKAKPVNGKMDGSALDPWACAIAMSDALLATCKMAPEIVHARHDKKQKFFARLYVDHFEAHAPKLAGRMGAEVFDETVKAAKNYCQR